MQLSVMRGYIHHICYRLRLSLIGVLGVRQRLDGVPGVSYAETHSAQHHSPTTFDPCTHAFEQEIEPSAHNPQRCVLLRFAICVTPR